MNNDNVVVNRYKGMLSVVNVTYLSISYVCPAAFTYSQLTGGVISVGKCINKQLFIPTTTFLLSIIS